ncbi:MAG: DUF2461 domain-containing protein [Bacteroidetes bacterium]|nr:DUF2461 domain-containing protein [Bacteroidota bacterium]
MFSKEALNYLSRLKENNNKIWFDTNRRAYEAARKELTVFAEKLITGVGKFEPGVKKIEPKKSLFRINREVRQGSDKLPYKNNMGVWMNALGKDAKGVGYYFHLEPGNSFIAGGIYLPDADTLKVIRHKIADNLKDFETILANKDVKKIFGGMSGEKLKTTPKDFPKEHPALEHLKYKSYTMIYTIDDKKLHTAGLAEECVKMFKLMQPFNAFLLEAVAIKKKVTTPAV